MPPNPIDIDPSRDPGEWYSHQREVQYARKERWISGDLEERNDFTVHTSTFSIMAASIVERAEQQGYAVVGYLIGSTVTNTGHPNGDATTRNAQPGKIRTPVAGPDNK